VLARSLSTAGRSIFGRPAAALVVALIAILAVGAPAALADEPSGGVEAVADALQAAAVPVDVPPVELPAVEPPQVELPEVEPPSVEPPAVEPPPVDAPSVDSPSVDPPSSDPPPAGPLHADVPAANVPVADPPPAPEPVEPAPRERAANGGAGAPPAASQESGSGGARSVAQNVNRVIQAVWQVQRGCRSHCYGTSQTQRSVQWSQTTQSATAVAGEPEPESPGSSSSSAEARNESFVVQFVWQMQIGCVAFCFETSQAQEASQHSDVDQDALAQSALTAWAENLSETLQYVFQTQEGCEHECHGTSQWQSSSQQQSTSQSATATGGADAVAVSSPALADDGTVLVPGWLTALAQNLGVTIQTVYQHQEASCLERCWGDAQVQEAIQRALTTQEAVAEAPPLPEPEVPPPPPGEEPPGEQPPSGEQQPAPPLVPETGAPADPGVTAVLAVGQVTKGPRRGRVQVWMVLRRQKGERSPDALTAVGDSFAPFGPALTGASPAAAAPADLAAATPIEPVRRARSESRPARTLEDILAPDPGASLGWVVFALLALALALFGVTARQLHRLRHP
jgi:hypothetical protein